MLRQRKGFLRSCPAAIPGIITVLILATVSNAVAAFSHYRPKTVENSPCLAYHGRLQCGLPSTQQSTTITATGKSRTTALFADNDHVSFSTAGNVSRRKQLLLGWSIAGVVGLLYTGQPAEARDEIYHPNPLANPFLERLRIWDQAEADELKYGGELERGDAGNKGRTDAYPRLLVPIVQMAGEIDRVEHLVSDELTSRNQAPSWKLAADIVDQPKYDKVQFKKAFNAFGDNIYYSDPDRANLYLGGGATPRTEQSLAYLLRNDVLTNVEALRAELQYLLSHPEEENTEDLRSYAHAANMAMQQYLDIVPPEMSKSARDIIMGG